MTKPMTVWCVVMPSGLAIVESTAHSRKGAIHNHCKMALHGEERGLEWWKEDKKNGYRCVKFILEPCDE